MKGPWKTRKRKSKKTPPKTVSNQASPLDSEESNTVLGSDFAIEPGGSLLSTPKEGKRRTRQTQDVCWTSTPVRSSSADHLTTNSESPPGAKQAGLEYTEVITQLKTVEADLPDCKSKSPTKPKTCDASTSRPLRRRLRKDSVKTCIETKSPQAKRKLSNPTRTKEVNLQSTASLSSKRSRPRFELKTPDSPAEDESLLSSDLSIELSPPEEQLPPFPFQEDEECEEEEEELPSFLMQMDKKPPSITEGAFVWHKVRNFPFWPALVKRMNRKQKKASIVFIDNPMIHTKKGFSVALKILKPFDCEEASELVCKAREKYDAVIEWSTELITDYRIRIACGSFSGSFINYFAHDMSYPVRRKYPQTEAEKLNITSESMIEEPENLTEASFSDQQEKAGRISKRLLPDRTHAAHNRANEKLVHFIVKQHMVEDHLLAVIRGQQQSRWLRSCLTAKRTQFVNTYLEDEKQLDEVFCYLNQIYDREMATASCLASVKAKGSVSFVMDVLLPEAIIQAIAGVNNVSIKQAEEKYIKGRCISKREMQELDSMIEQHIREKNRNTALALLSDSVKLDN